MFYTRENGTSVFVYISKHRTELVNHERKRKPVYIYLLEIGRKWGPPLKNSNMSLLHESWKAVDEKYKIRLMLGKDIFYKNQKRRYVSLILLTRNIF